MRWHAIQGYCDATFRHALAISDDSTTYAAYKWADHDHFVGYTATPWWILVTGIRSLFGEPDAAGVRCWAQRVTDPRDGVSTLTLST